jgi:hypothetical protein
MRTLAPKVELCNQSVPQRLKPSSAYGIYGTAEAVPFVESFSAACKIDP